MWEHKPIRKPPSPNVTRASWLIGVSHTCPVSCNSHTQTRGPLFFLKVKSWWEAEAPHDGLMEHDPLCTHVDLSPRHGMTAAHKANVAPSHQCISMRGSPHLCLYVCIGGGGDCNKAKSICRLNKTLCGACNPKPGQWLSPLPTSTDSILIYDSNEYWFSKSTPSPHPPCSISPFNKRVNDVCALIPNQLLLFSFYLSLDKFSSASVERNASLSIELYLITNWPFDGSQENNEEFCLNTAAP